MINQRQTEAPPSTGVGPEGKIRRKRRTPRRHLLDHLQVLRTHWVAVLVAFILVFGLKIWSTLLESRVYRSAATIQLNPLAGSGSESHYSEYWAWERSLEAAAESEVMRSTPVAEHAARRTDTQAIAAVQEENAYRPLEVATRSFGDGWLPCRLRAYAAPIANGVEVYLLTFDADGTSLQVQRVGGKFEGRVEAVALAEPFSDLNDNLVWDAEEWYRDKNEDGRYNPAEPYLDLDRSGKWDGAEPFTDVNENGVWDPAELYIDENRNDVYDVGEFFHDADLSGTYDQAEPYLEENQNGTWDCEEPFSDRNGNGTYDAAEVSIDRDRDGKWDAEEPFQDLNKDGKHDAGRPMNVGGSSVTLALEGGDPSGRTFVLTLRSIPAATNWIRGGVSARERGEYTGIMSLGFEADTPETAARVANALVEAYLAFVRSEKTQQDRNRVDWLTEEVTRLDAELAELERARDDYVKRHRAVLLGERAQAILSEQGELFRQRLALEQEVRAIDKHLEELTQGAAADRQMLLLGAGVVDVKTSALTTQLADLETRRSILVVVDEVTDENPLVQKIDAEIGELKTLLHGRVKLLTDRQVEQLSTKRTGIETRLGQISSEYERQERMLQELPDKEREVAKRTRPIRVQEQMYEFLVRTLKEAQLSKESQVLPVRALNPAARPHTRLSPNLTRTLALGLFLGLLAGLAVAFALEYMTRTIQSPRELEDGLDLPLYGAIPDLATLSRRDRKAITTHGVASRDAPRSILAEAYRNLRAGLRYSSNGRPPRTLAITSAVAQEGKTVTTLNLAVVLAQSGRRVLVVDADLRRPQAHLYFKMEQSPGLTEVLRDECAWQSSVHATDVEHLSLIPAGNSPGNPGALLDSMVFRDLIRELRAEYDFVLFDVPPVLAVADAAAFFRELDGVLLLARYRKCTLETIDGAREQAERAGALVLGTILNAFDARRASVRGADYFGYYGYYGAYGDATS